MSLVNRKTKPTIQLNIATYEINGQIDNSGAEELIQRVNNHLTILRGMRIEGILLSFKGITKIEKNALLNIIKNFTLFHVKLRCVVGFSDYSTKVYTILKQLLKASPLGLYKNTDIMALAIGTSNVKRNISVLVYAEDIDERQLIASTLISNNYFVVMAVSKTDFEKKAKNKESFDRSIGDSYFSNIDEDVTVSFSKNIFMYEFRGTLDDTLSKRINVDDFKYRLSLGYNVIILDFTNIYHMNTKAAYFLLELLQIAEKHKSLICCIELKNERMDNNAIGILGKCPIWVFDDYEHVFKDKEVIEMTSAMLPSYTTGISKELLGLIPHFTLSTMEALDLYEIANTEKSPSKQANIRNLYATKPTIITNVKFSGDFEGEFFFLFTQKSVNTLIKHILVDFDDYEEEEYLDAMNEFVNSVSGKLKSNLRKKYKCIQFSLPESKSRLEEFIPITSKHSFILTKFECDENEYYVALTSPIDPELDLLDIY